MGLPWSYCSLSRVTQLGAGWAVPRGGGRPIPAHTWQLMPIPSFYALQREAAASPLAPAELGVPREPGMR